LGCNESCGSYDNRADAYLKLRYYTEAVADLSLSIRRVLSHAVFLMREIVKLVEELRRARGDGATKPRV
jgi:hypothetical protein